LPCAQEYDGRARRAPARLFYVAQDAG